MDEPPPARESEAHPLPFYTLADPELLGPAARFERWLRLAVLPFIGANVLLISLLVATTQVPESAGVISSITALAACVVFALALVPPSNRPGREFGLCAGVSLALLALSAFGDLGIWIGPVLYAVIVAFTYRAKKISFLAVLPFAYGPLSWVLLFPGELAPKIVSLVAIAAAATVCLLRRFFLLGSLLTLAVIVISALVLLGVNQASTELQVCVAGLVLLILAVVFGLEIAVHRAVDPNDPSPRAAHPMPSDFRIFVGQVPFVVLSLLPPLLLIANSFGIWVWFGMVLVGELLLAWLRPYAFGAALSWIGIAFCLAWREVVSLHGSLPSLFFLIFVCALLTQVGFTLRNGFLRTTGVVLLALATFPSVVDLHTVAERWLALLSLALVYFFSVADGFSLGLPWWQGIMTLEGYNWLTHGAEKVRGFLDSNFITRAIHAAVKGVIAWAVYLKGGEAVTLLDAGAIYGCAGLAFVVARSGDWAENSISGWVPFLSQPHLFLLWTALSWAVAGVVSYALGVFNGVPLQRAAGFILILVPALSWKEWAGRDLIAWCLIGTVAGLACVIFLLVPHPRTGRAISMALRQGFLRRPVDDNRRAAHPGVLACVFAIGLAASFYGVLHSNSAGNNINDYLDQMLAGESPEAYEKSMKSGSHDYVSMEQAKPEPGVPHLPATDDEWTRQDILRSAGNNLAQEARDAVASGGRVNSLGMAFVPVPAAGVDFSIWDVRVCDYDAFLKDSHYDPRNDPQAAGQDPGYGFAEGRYLPLFQQTPNDPVVLINAYEAKAFCAWLTNHDRKAHLIPDDKEYRLPYLSEWKAAYGVKNGQVDENAKGWSLGWPLPYGQANIGGDLFVNNQTCPVGAFRANDLGLYDVIGNVAQWCNNGAPDKGASSLYIAGVTFARSVDPADRPDYALGSIDSAQRAGNVGFRCVLSPLNKAPVPPPSPDDP